MAIGTKYSQQVHEPELTPEELEQVVGGWSVDTLSQMGGGGSGKVSMGQDLTLTHPCDRASP
jgi:hypothetical protein